MASAFSHIAIPILVKFVCGAKTISWRLLIFAMFASVAPDLDSIAFVYGIPYESQWGHRGFTHSILFALVFAVFSTIFHRVLKANRLAVFTTSFISMLSHGVLDACTTGGLGVAFFWPMNSDRYFLPWQVIEVSPISIKSFFSKKGLTVLSSEFFYVWLPCIVVGVVAMLLNITGKWYMRKKLK